MTERTISKLERAALGYAALGWRVFPLQAYNPGFRGDPKQAPGKRPLHICDPPCLARLPRADPKTNESVCKECGTVHVKGTRGLHIATTDPAIISQWWARYPRANIGIATGAGLLVVDLDGPDGEAWLAARQTERGPIPATPTQQTASGRHLVFRIAKELRNSASRLAPHVDIRGDGGYIVAAPSVHPSGATYRWLEDRRPSRTPIADAPQWLLDEIEAMQAQPPTEADAPAVNVERPSMDDVPDAYVRKALDSEFDAVAKAPPGRRNQSLNSAAFSLGQLVGAGLLAESLVRRTLEAAATASGLMADDGRAQVDATISSGLRAGMAQPRVVKPRDASQGSGQGSGAGKGRGRPELRVVGGQEVREPESAREPASALPPRVRWLIDNWRDHVVFKDHETEVLHPKATKNVIAALLYRSDLAGLFAFNKRAKRVHTMQQPPWTSNGTPYPRVMNDGDAVGLRSYLESHGLRLSKADIMDSIAYAAMERGVDPVRERLESLAWDGLARLDTWAIDCLSAPDTPFVRTAAAKWMIAAAARIVRPGCKFDHMLVLEGDQRLGKSTAFSTLAEALGPDLFTDRLSRIDSKDASIELLGKVIVELAEITALKKADYDEAKAFLSRRHDDIRLPYDRTVTRLARGCVFAGTVNPDGSGWLKDPTGNSRYWPIPVKAVDLERLARDAVQLWAEAHHRFKAGENWWIEDRAVLDLHKDVTAERTEEDVWSSLIDRYLQGHDRVQVADVLVALEVPKSRMTPADSRRVMVHLRKRGWFPSPKPLRIQGRLGRYWLAPAAASGELVGAEEAPGAWDPFA